MDGATIYDRPLFEKLRDLAEANDIPWQTKEDIAGGNDARTIQRTKSGVRVAAMSAAVRYLHAPTSVGSMADFENMERLVMLFLNDLAQEA
jgi:endoglucanase